MKPDDSVDIHVRGGSPESFGYLRRKELDRVSFGCVTQVWEKPNGEFFVFNERQHVMEQRFIAKMLRRVS